MRHLAVIGLCIILSSELFPYFPSFLSPLSFSSIIPFCVRVLFCTLRIKLHSLSFVYFAIVFPCFRVCRALAALLVNSPVFKFQKPFDLLLSCYARHLLIIFRLMRFNFIMHIYFQPTHPTPIPPQLHRCYPFYVQFICRLYSCICQRGRASHFHWRCSNSSKNIRF